ncbi:MAG: ankyrin repeat domain-containing protein [Bryobacteraceae bacterium]
MQGVSGLQRHAVQEAERIEQHWRKLRESYGHAAQCTLAAAQLFIAREHGFASWPIFARHVRESNRTDSPVSAFEAAADAIITGDLPRLRKLLDTHPGLARERSSREHRSTLLHYVSANGVEDFRQKTPQNIVAITNLLLDAGADVNATSDVYGGGCTTLGLVATSIHPERAGVQIQLLRTLLDRGASFVPPGAGAAHQNIVNACLANGRRNSARFFAELGAPLNLEGAAAIDRVDVLRTLFEEEGDQRQPNQKDVESAFLYACGYGSRAAAEFLLERGVNVNARNDAGQTALHWASYEPHPRIIKLLLGRGASVDVKDDRFHATPLDTALWRWQNSEGEREEARERCYEAIALLARAGARLQPDHWKHPGEERSPMLDMIASDARMEAALRGESQVFDPGLA